MTETEIKALLQKNYSELIDDSPYPLDAWVQALVAFHQWKIVNKREIRFEHQVEYLACCIEGTSSPVPLVSLPKLWEDFVTQYGVE